LPIQVALADGEPAERLGEAGGCTVVGLVLACRGERSVWYVDGDRSVGPAEEQFQDVQGDAEGQLRRLAMVRSRLQRDAEVDDDLTGIAA
jgi:hypothetical protein